MYRFIKDYSDHPGIICYHGRNEHISWNKADAKSPYCPTCHNSFDKVKDNADYEEGSFVEKAVFLYNLYFRPQKLVHSFDGDCPKCDDAIEREDQDPMTPGVQTKLSMKLKGIKDPKKKAALWLESVKK
jgi:hypothetical protein